MPTLEEMATTPRSGLSLEQMATTAKGPEVSQFDNFDDQQKARIRNTLLYSGMSNRLPGEVYDYTSGINQQIHGSPDEVTAWKKNIGIIKETKSYGQAVEHALIVAGKNVNKTLKDAGWVVADLDQQFWNWVGVKQPEILKRWDEEAFLFKRIVDAELEMFYRKNPDKLPEAAPETGYLQKALWYSENPKVVLQHAVQSAPIMLLGGLGKVAGLGKAGMIALFGGPTAAETYTEARAEGTEVTPALGQSLLTGAGEGAIEEWTFGRKIGIAQNFSKIVKGGWPKVAWEALKAYGRGTAEEAGQQTNRNFWQFIFTDANQKISEGVADAAAAGGPVELLMAGVFGMGGYTISKTGEMVDQTEQHRRLNIIEGEIQKSQNFTDEQKAEISQEIDSVRKDVDSGVYLPEEEAETSAHAIEVPVASQTGETGAVEAVAKAGPGAEATFNLQEVKPIKSPYGDYESAAIINSLPPVPEGMVRVFRTEHEGRTKMSESDTKRFGQDDFGRGGWFTTDFDYVLAFYEEYKIDGAKLYYLDLTQEQAQKYFLRKQGYRAPIGEFADVIGEEVINANAPVADEYLIPELRPPPAPAAEALAKGEGEKAEAKPAAGQTAETGAVEPVAKAGPGAEQVVYRASREPYEPGKIGELGLFVTPDKSYAESWAETHKRKVETLTISPDANILKREDIPAQFVTKYPDGSEVITTDNQEALIRYAKEKGYDGYEDFDVLPNGSIRKAFAIFNPDVLSKSAPAAEALAKGERRPELVEGGEKAEGPVEPIKPLEEGPERKVSTLAKKTRLRAIEAGIEDDFGELPEYGVMNKAEQAEHADTLVAEDSERALRIATMKEEGPLLPSGQRLRAGSVYKALELDAIAKKRGDVTLALMKSPISLHFTGLGQEIAAMDRAVEHSPTKALKQISERLERTAQKKHRTKDLGKLRRETQTSIEKQVRETQRKTTPRRETWEQFIQSIRCN